MTDTNTLFITASRKKFRFESTRGDLTVEQLWDLPLTSTTGFSLDAVARDTNMELKGLAEESFVETSTNPRKGDLEAMLEIVKFVIAAKQAENAKARDAVDRAEKRRKLIDAIAAKENEEISSKSKDELLQQLAAMDA